MEQAEAIADLLVSAAARGHRRAARAAQRHGPRPTTSSRSTGSRTRPTRSCRAAVAQLFAHGIDPMIVIRWKDIFETLEESVDACERVANVLEGITLKQRSRR